LPVAIEIGLFPERSQFGEAGGGALLRGIDKLVAEETGLPVHIAEDPLSAVAEGTGRVLQELQFLKRVAFSSKS